MRRNQKRSTLVTTSFPTMDQQLQDLSDVASLLLILSILLCLAIFTIPVLLVVTAFMLGGIALGTLRLSLKISVNTLLKWIGIANKT